MSSPSDKSFHNQVAYAVVDALYTSKQPRETELWLSFYENRVRLRDALVQTFQYSSDAEQYDVVYETAVEMLAEFVSA